MSSVAAPAPGPRARLARFFAPLTRLFAPQMSSAARERRDMMVLLLAVAFVVVPHFEHLAWWATAVLLLLFFWRAFLTITQQPLPGRWLMVPLLLGAGVGVYLQYGTLAGQQAGVTFLLLLMALKLLEMRARRDIFVVIFLSFFILLTQFLYGQGLPVAAMTLLAVIALFFVLVGVNLDDIDLPASRKLRLVAMTLLKSVPLTLVLFVLFPRISGPLWGTPGDSGTGSTGLSNSMAPGSISRLLESGEIAFRVRFDGVTPTNDKLYWRGPVFGTFNGRSWSPLPPRAVDADALTIEADARFATSYTVTLEPHKRDWLFALEVPAAPPVGLDLQTRLTPELQLLATDLVTQRLRYQMRSYTSFRFGARAGEGELAHWRALPPNYNPRSLQFAEDLRARVAAQSDTSGDLQLVNAVIDHFRRNRFEYTLAPPRLGRHSVDEFMFDTRQGYCEHYSSAFVFLMRALDIPARVVTGYQGGELNPVDNFLTIRQSDAHAWAEVWLRGRGWVRVDPTAAVAPLRIDAGAAALARQSGIVLPGVSRDIGWLRSVQFNWEAVQNAWNQWVLSYSQERQRALADLLGLAPTLESIALVLAAVIVVVLAAMAALSMRSRIERDPLGETYRQLRDRLDRAGVSTAEHLGPRELYSRSKRALERSDAQRARKLLSRIERMRYSRSSEGVSAADVRALRRAVRAFHPRTISE